MPLVVCHFPKHPAGVIFPNIRHLTLHDITSLESTIHDMNLVCPKIRSLLLRDNKGFCHVHISSSSLVSLGMSVEKHDEPVMEQLTIVHAP
jgi:hypothetical protein